MLEDKIAALLRGLPGALRRNFVPVPDWAKAAAAAVGGVTGMEASGRKPEVAAQNSGVSAAPPGHDASLREALAAYLARQTGVEIKAEDFSEEGLPSHLRMNFKVMDDSAKVLGLSRDLPQLQRKLAREAAGTFAGIYQREFNRNGITVWDFGDLPESVTVQRFKMSIVAYPALVDQGDTCALRLLPSKESGQEAHRAGVRRLFWLGHRREIKGLTAKLPDFARMKLQYLLLGRSIELRDDLLTLIVDRALFADPGQGTAETTIPRKQAEFEALHREGGERLNASAEKVGGLVSAILEEHLKLALVVEAARAEIRHARGDVHDQLVYLLPKHFLVRTDFRWLEHFPRYLAAMRTRLEKLAAGGPVIERDAQAMELVTPFVRQYELRKREHDAIGLRDPELELFRWMLEEYRVSLFAQELGMAIPVSQRRMERQWELVRR
jgi:ATP-dependent helicase HrpA